MKNFKLVFVALALVLTTVGVFAGRARFAAQDIYADVSGTKIKLATTSSYNDLSISGSVQAQIVSSQGNTYNLVAKDGTSYVPLYTTTF